MPAEALQQALRELRNLAHRLPGRRRGAPPPARPGHNRRPDRHGGLAAAPGPSHPGDQLAESEAIAASPRGRPMSAAKPEHEGDGRGRRIGPRRSFPCCRARSGCSTACSIAWSGSSSASSSGAEPPTCSSVALLYSADGLAQSRCRCPCRGPGHSRAEAMPKPSSSGIDFAGGFPIRQDSAWADPARPAGSRCHLDHSVQVAADGRGDDQGAAGHRLQVSPHAEDGSYQDTSIIRSAERSRAGMSSWLTSAANLTRSATARSASSRARSQLSWSSRSMGQTRGPTMMSSASGSRAGPDHVFQPVPLMR